MGEVSIDVYELARTGKTRGGQIALGDMLRLQSMCAAAEVDGIYYQWQGFIDTQGRPAAALQLKARLPLICTHCDQTAEVNLEVQRQYYFVRDERALEAIKVDIEACEPLVGGEHFDVLGLVEDELILALPIAPRHEICQQAIDQKGGAMELSGTAKPDGPFAELAGLKTSLRK